VPRLTHARRNHPARRPDGHAAGPGDAGQGAAAPEAVTAPASGTAAGPVASRRRRIAILAICSLSLFIVGLDNTIVNVALPSLQRELHAGYSGLQWVIDSYLIVLASLLLLSGSTGDRIGRRRMFQTGLIIFTAGSLLCSLAPNLGTLVAFRMLQAIGGSMLNPNSLSIITNVFTNARERATAIGIWGAVFGLSAASGPVFGGLLTSGIGWRAVFWVNVPVGLAAFVLAARFVPESKAGRARRPDPPGQALAIAFLASLIYAIIEGPSRGWASPLIAGLFAVSAAALAAFILTERRRVDPLLDIRFFRSPPFAGATALATVVFFVFAGFLFLNTLYLQQVRGQSPLEAGAWTLPLTIVLAVVSPLAGRFVGRHGPRLPVVAAGIAFAAGGAVLAQVTPGYPFGYLVLAYVLLGIAFGLVNPAITNGAVAGMPRSQAGVASATASVCRQVGSALGVALIGAIVTSGLGGAVTGSGMSSGLASSSARAAFSMASHAAWWLTCGCGVAVAVIGWVTSGRRARAAADRTAERLGGDLAVDAG
jgi:EmrB/QacA subfamily drug resistance transporter